MLTCIKCLSSGMQCCVVWQEFTYVSEILAASMQFLKRRQTNTGHDIPEDSHLQVTLSLDTKHRREEMQGVRVDVNRICGRPLPHLAAVPPSAVPLHLIELHRARSLSACLSYEPTPTPIYHHTLWATEAQFVRQFGAAARPRLNSQQMQVGFAFLLIRT